MSILAVLMGALASAIVLATRALPANSEQRDSDARVRGSMEQIVEDLRAATWFIERSPSQITFTVPDRNGDGVPERIRYRWSGTPGEALFREVNGGGEGAFLPAVDSFAVSWQTKTRTETFVGKPVESTETVLRSYRGSNNMAEGDIKSDKSYGEYFRPILPADAVGWSVKRASIYAKRDNENDGVNRVELWPVDAMGRPATAAIDQQTMLESSLGTSFAKMTFNYTLATGFEPTAGLALLVRNVSGTNKSAKVEYQSGSASLPNAALISSSGSWEVEADKALSFEIMGTYFQPGAPQSMQYVDITDATLQLTVGGQTVHGSVGLVNRPRALSAHWRTAFSSDPTVDGNGDGSPDWESHSGPINLGNIVARAWTGTQRLNTVPDCHFRKPTRAFVRFQAASAAGSSAEFSMPFDWSNGTTACIVATLTTQANGSQTLVVSSKRTEATLRTLVTVTNLSPRIVELHLRLDAAEGIVNVETDHVPRGTFFYERYAPVTDLPRASIKGSGSGGIFENVKILVAE